MSIKNIKLLEFLNLKKSGSITSLPFTFFEDQEENKGM